MEDTCSVSTNGRYKFTFYRRYSCNYFANNLLSAMIDNHIYFGNELGFKKVVWKRCVDLNDRALRKIEIGLSGEKIKFQENDGFDITVASEIMAIFVYLVYRRFKKKRIGK